MRPETQQAFGVRVASPTPLEAKRKAQEKKEADEKKKREMEARAKAATTRKRT